jgi:hypothetical protein
MYEKFIFKEREGTIRSRDSAFLLILHEVGLLMKSYQLGLSEKRILSCSKEDNNDSLNANCKLSWKKGTSANYGFNDGNQPKSLLALWSKIL